LPKDNSGEIQELAEENLSGGCSSLTDHRKIDSGVNILARSSVDLFQDPGYVQANDNPGLEGLIPVALSRHPSYKIEPVYCDSY
jgi:hypothetical protein